MYLLKNCNLIINIYLFIVPYYLEDIYFIFSSFNLLLLQIMNNK